LKVLQPVSAELQYDAIKMVRGADTVNI
jgi:hypothetical protein